MDPHQQEYFEKLKNYIAEREVNLLIDDVLIDNTCLVFPRKGTVT